MAFTTISNALLLEFVSKFDFLHVDNSFNENDDEVTEYLLGEDDPGGALLLKFLQMEHRTAEPFDKATWVITFTGVIVLPVDLETIDAITASVLDILQTIFRPNFRPGGAALARVIFVDKPIQGLLNDTPFQWIPFVIEVLEKPTR